MFLRRFRSPQVAQVALAGLLLAGCQDTSMLRPDLPTTTSTQEAFEGVQCTAVRPPTEPDLMGWDAGSRANLGYLRKQGVVPVRYKAIGCNVELEVLSNCIGEGQYSYTPYSASDTKIARTVQELFADLPVGAARLSGKLKGGRALRTDYVLVGMATLPVGSSFDVDGLRGTDCDRATHVVNKIYVGGFGMEAGDAQTVSTSAGAFSLKLTGERDSSAERLVREGSVEACGKAQVEGAEHPLCAVPLRIALLPVARSSVQMTEAPKTVEPPKVTEAPKTVEPPKVTEAPKTVEPAKTTETRLDLYLRSRREYEAADRLPDGPERARAWLAAASGYEAALRAGPASNEAPEAAMNGAFAYKQLGQYGKAIELYELFVSRYASEDALVALRSTDANKYEDRVKYLASAYDALAGAFVLFFNYPRAAEIYETTSQSRHFAQPLRRAAARQALSLYASLGYQPAVKRTQAQFQRLGPTRKELAEADFIVASVALKKWDEHGRNEGDNAVARDNLQRDMDSFHAANKANPAAAPYLVQAAYWSAKARRAASAVDTKKWWNNTIDAFDKWHRAAPPDDRGRNSALGSREANMAGEAEFTLRDAEISKAFDYESGHHRYKGTTSEVLAQYENGAVEAKRWFDKLQHIVDAYVSPHWTTVAIARQGSLYDSLRTGLYNARAPALKVFDAKTQSLLNHAESSQDAGLLEQAAAARVAATRTWRDKRDTELNSADVIMVDRYANATVLAKRYAVSDPQVSRAIRRLAFFTDIIGEAKMTQFAASVRELHYTAGMFPRMRPGLYLAQRSTGDVPPLPALVP